eukprot:1490378-Rhodomonas_salina.1
MIITTPTRVPGVPGYLGVPIWAFFSHRGSFPDLEVSNQFFGTFSHSGCHTKSLPGGRKYFLPLRQSHGDTQVLPGYPRVPGTGVPRDTEWSERH